MYDISLLWLVRSALTNLQLFPLCLQMLALTRWSVGFEDVYKNMWEWLFLCAIQFLQHLLVCAGPIVAIICVWKYLAMTLHLNSLHIFELVTDCASRHISVQCWDPLFIGYVLIHFLVLCFCTFITAWKTRGQYKGASLCFSTVSALIDHHNLHIC